MGEKIKTPGAAGTATEGKFKAGQPQRKSTAKQPTRQQKWRQRNPASYLAHLTVRNAVRLGVLVPQPCEICGAEKGEAHHPDYANPLEVVWLCRKHHSALHKRSA